MNDQTLQFLQALQAQRQSRTQAADALLQAMSLPPDVGPPVFFSSPDDLLAAYRNLYGQPTVPHVPGLQFVRRPGQPDFSTLRSPELRLDVPAHYGYGDEWEQRGWLDLLARIRTPSQRGPGGESPPLDAPTLLRFLRLIFSEGPIPTPEATPLAAPPASPPLAEPPAPHSRLYRQRVGDTVFYGNAPPPWPWSR